MNCGGAGIKLVVCFVFRQRREVDTVDVVFTLMNFYQMDVFDEGICDDVISEDWAKVERLRRTNGYREGLAAGQESTLQEGFNEGFSKGTQATFTVSFIKGIVNALITNISSSEDQDDKDCVSELQAILSELDTLHLQEDCGKRSIASQRYDTGGGADDKLTAKQQGEDGTCRCGNTADSTSSNATCPSGKDPSQGSPQGNASGKDSESCSSSSAHRSSDDHTGEAVDTEPCCGILADLTLNPTTAASGSSNSEDAASGSASSTSLERQKTDDSQLDADRDSCHGNRGKEHALHARDPALQKILGRLESHLSRLLCAGVLSEASHPFLRL